jgi:uncharacterized protein YdhG (YjbR/CyaY superfamily)
MAKTDCKTIDQYINSFSEDVQRDLQQIRTTILQAVPQAEETISYQIPAVKYEGWITYFSAYTHHYSLSFPPPFTVFEKFNKELLPYKRSTSTVQFPKGKPLPLDLIRRMAKFRAEENLSKKRQRKKSHAKTGKAVLTHTKSSNR